MKLGVVSLGPLETMPLPLRKFACEVIPRLDATRVPTLTWLEPPKMMPL
jgi:hypothetical protein